VFENDSGVPTNPQLIVMHFTDLLELLALDECGRRS
jgi:hypothetical protein